MQAEDDPARLPWDPITRVVESLPTNDVVLIWRLVCKEFWRRFSQPHYRVARFGLPLPPVSSCGAWRPHLQQYLKQLTFCSKFRILSAAASSGSEVNLEFAWDILRPSLAHGKDRYPSGASDAGAAAVKSDHLHLLPWLLQHGCPLDAHSTVNAAAEHSDLAGLQHVWELLGCGPDPPGQHGAKRYGDLTNAAAGSDRDAIAKLTWLMAMAERSKEHFHGQWLLLQAASGAVSSGRLPVLQWLLELALQGGVPTGELWSRVVDVEARGLPLAQALGKGHVAVADWLVDEAGYPLPQQEQDEDLAHVMELENQQEAEQELLWKAAAWGGSVDTLRWLILRGVPVCPDALSMAVRGGHLEAVRFLHEVCGVGLEDCDLLEAAGSRSVPTAQWLLQAGCHMDPEAYLAAAREGDVAMIRWLALDAKCPWSQSTVADILGIWAYKAGNSTDGLKEAVRLLLEAGCPCSTSYVAINGAARTGRLPLLRYLHEELGMGFWPYTLTEAAGGGCEEVLEWLVGAGYGAGEGRGGSEAYVAAASHGDMATLRCLRRLGVPWDERVVMLAVEYCCTPTSAVQWLVEQGAPVNREAVERANENARNKERWKECAEWLADRMKTAQRCL